MSKVTIRNNENYRETLDRIKLLLMNKAIYEKMPQDANNKTHIGNVSFWFQKEKGTENYYLIFDRDTATWDLNGIKEDIESWEYTVLKKNLI